MLTQAELKPPSRGRKTAFWLLIGIFSVLFVEVPAGSTMFPFWTIWGVLVVIPLYLLHSVFLAALVFRYGRPSFWPLYAAGTLYGMYEAYITKVLWTSFRPEGPFFRFAGIALFETILLVFFLHAILAFMVPLLFTELLCTNSREIEQGLPHRIRESFRQHPRAWVGALMGMLGFMQFVNSPSVAKSFISGAGNSLVLGVAVWWWRRSGGANYSMCDLLPGSKGIRNFGIALAAWYLFWGAVIKKEALPPVFPGQFTIWILYVVLLLVFWWCLQRSKREVLSENQPATDFEFSWRGFVLACSLATVVTCVCRLLLFPFAGLQILLMFTFYVVIGLLLFGLSVKYAFAKTEQN